MAHPLTRRAYKVAQRGAQYMRAYMGGKRCMHFPQHIYIGDATTATRTVSSPQRHIAIYREAAVDDRCAFENSSKGRIFDRHLRNHDTPLHTCCSCHSRVLHRCLRIRCPTNAPTHTTVTTSNSLRVLPFHARILLPALRRDTRRKADRHRGALQKRKDMRTHAQAAAAWRWRAICIHAAQVECRQTFTRL